MGDPFYRGIYAYGTSVGPEPNAYNGFIARYDDVGGSVILPNWIPLPLNSLGGNYVTANGNSVIFPEDATLRVQLQAMVLHSWGRTIYSGYSRNGGDIEMLEATLVESNVPVLVLNVRVLNVSAGDEIGIFVSSDFQYAQFAVMTPQIIGIVV